MTSSSLPSGPKRSSAKSLRIRADKAQRRRSGVVEFSGARDGEITETNIEILEVTKFDATLGELNGANPDPQGNIKKFVAIGSEPLLSHYSSQLPLVIYAPEGVEIRYRAWQPGAKVAVEQDK